jgi:hypothetical protein
VVEVVEDIEEFEEFEDVECFKVLIPYSRLPRGEVQECQRGVDAFVEAQILRRKLWIDHESRNHMLIKSLVSACFESVATMSRIVGIPVSKNGSLCQLLGGSMLNLTRRNTWGKYLYDFIVAWWATQGMVAKKEVQWLPVHGPEPYQAPDQLDVRLAVQQEFRIITCGGVNVCHPSDSQQPETWWNLQAHEGGVS